jgi:hypothetical protein
VLLVGGVYNYVNAFFYNTWLGERLALLHEVINAGVSWGSEAMWALVAAAAAAAAAAALVQECSLLSVARRKRW